MPSIKQKFYHAAFDLSVFRMRLPGLKKKDGDGVYYLGMDDGAKGEFGFEIIKYWEKEARRHDEGPKAVTYATYHEKTLRFTYLPEKNLLGMQSIRCEKPLYAAMTMLGIPITIEPAIVLMIPWVKAMQTAHPNCQMGNILVNNLPVEDKFFGKYDAKSINNAVDMPFIIQHSEQVREIKLGWFDYGCKYSICVSSNGTIQCSTRDEDNLFEFYTTETERLFKFFVPENLQLPIISVDHKLPSGNVTEKSGSE